MGYRWRCQIQENAKQLAFHHVIPEMNHNEIVGWTNSNPNMIPVLIRKTNEADEIRNRFEALKNTAWKINESRGNICNVRKSPRKNA